MHRVSELLRVYSPCKPVPRILSPRSMALGFESASTFSVATTERI